MEKIDDKHMQGVSPENRLGQIDRAKIYRQTSFHIGMQVTYSCS